LRSSFIAPEFASQVLTRLLLLAICAGAWSGLGAAQELTVNVRERSGGPLTAEAVVRVIWPGHGTMVGTTGGGTNQASTATFHVQPGEFDIEVEAAGYDKATEHAVFTREGLRQTVYVFLTHTGSRPTSTAPQGVTLTPAVQKELQKSLEEMKKGRYDEARKHLQRAQKLAPSNPDIQYMMGILDYTAKDFPAARKQFEAVVAAYPTHERSLLMLGQMQLDAKDYKEAARTLQKAVDADEQNWRAHYLLALASAYSGDLPNAGVEAARAAELNREKAAEMRVLGAKLLMLEGKNKEARRAFEEFIETYPQDAAVPEAKKYIEKIDEAKKSADAAVATQEALKVSAMAAVTETAAKYDEIWAPPDVDAGIPPTAIGVACSTDTVLESARNRIERQLGDLEKFSATERIEHQMLETGGTWSKPSSKDFYYLISVYHNKKLPYYFVEDRTTDLSNSSFPTSIATRGLVSLGFMIINPAYKDDFQFSCEGLGSWNGKAAWQLHFVQRKDVPSHVRSWEYRGMTYPIPLKGRMWIGANTFNVMHLETALREPVEGSLRLNREQLSVDYGPIRFQSAATQLWLPLQGEMYFDLLKRRYHHKHALTNYLLFGVDTRNRIKAPAEPPPDPQP
jgi:tetratricopeptide (TPR) repeat protein